MGHHRLCGALLATSSALALMVAIDRSAEAATCTVVTNPGLPYAQAGNTCVTFTASPGTSGNITNTGTVTASGPSNPNGTGISLFLHPTVTGDIINQGTINANGFGVLMDQAKLNGSITNATGGTLNATGAGGAGIQVQGTRAAIATEGVSGSIINQGTIASVGVGINVGDVTIGAGIGNTGTINALTAIVVSEAAVTGNVSNGVTGQLIGNSTGVLQVVNGGTINGSVQNFGAITNNNVNGAGIYVYSSIGGIGTQAITGSIVNETNASISGGWGIKVISVLNTAAVVVGSGHVGDGVINAGTIGTSLNPVAHSGIEIGSGTVNGVVSNSGTITAAENGIQLINLKGTTPAIYNAGPASVTGGVTNIGSITSTGTGYAGIALSGSTVANGITNSSTGTINAANGVGLLLSDTGKHTNSGGVQSTFVGGPSSVTGGVANEGTITAKTGIMVTGGSTVDSITNSGTLTATGGTAIDVSGEGAATVINQQGGTISGAILLSSLGDTVNITGGSIAGNITGIGPSGTVNFALGSGNTFSYANAISGVAAVNVNSGTLFDNSSIAATTVSVNGGALAPGQPGTPGTLNVTGNLVFASAAAYLITINGGTAAKTAVTGNAAPGGASVKVASGSTINFGQTYTILTATGGVSGKFNPNVTFGSLSGTLTYDADDVFLSFNGAGNRITPLLPPGTPQNVLNVAGALDNFLGAGGMPPAGFMNLYGLTQQQLVNALSLLSGEAATGAQESGFQLMNSFLALLTGPAGSSGDGSGPAMPFAPERAQAFPSDVALAYASVLKAPPKPVPHWTTWAAAFGGSNQTNGDPTVGSHDQTARAGAVAAGMDYHVAPDTILGFSLAGGGTSWGLSGGLGGGRSDAFLAGLYGSQRWGQSYLSGALTYTSYWMSTNRSIAGVGADTLNASFNAQSFGGRLEGGFVAWSMPLRVVPYAAVQAQSFRSPAYSESGSLGAPDPFALSYAAQTATVVRSELGSRFDRLFAQADGSSVDWFSRIAWAHDWQSNPNLTATFIGLPAATFVVNGAPPPKDLALLTAGAEWRMRNGWALMGKFDGELARGSQTYTGTAKLSYTW